ncbi:MAG TPA: IS110 family transposase [Solirubrobacterales bacterium]|jgi:transposase|nr:IS110 family transposase [Solirubrobacterales bacterium]
MIVIGTDTHKRTHTCGAVFAGTGQRAGELTAPARKNGFAEMLDWGRELDPERIWALEDCRHVSGSLERFLIASGEHVVRVPPKLMGESRRGERTRGKSDPIDALAVARAALREGPETLPGAHLDEAALELKLLLDHREDLVKARSEDQQRLRWHLHDLWPELELPAGCLDRTVWLDRVARKLARAKQGARVRVSRELVRAIRERTKRASGLEREIGVMVRAQAPQLLALPGCGKLTAAKLIAETAGAARFSSDAKLARLAGIAPIPASSGSRTRLRLDRGGNRQLNCAVHRIAVTQGRMHPPARDFLARKRAEGKSNREALRCLKRHLIRRVWRLLNDSEIDRSVKTVDTQRGLSVPQFAAAA